MMLITGPKISSRAIFISSLTFGEHRWLDEVALVTEAVAASQEFRSFAFARIDVEHDLCHLHFVDLGALLSSWVERITNPFAASRARRSFQRTRRKSSLRRTVLILRSRPGLG